MDKILFLGREYEVVHTKGFTNGARFNNGKLEVITRIKSKAELKRVLKNWYRKQAKDILECQVARLNKEHGYNINRVCIKNQKSLWGSCSSERNLNFNMKLVMVPLEVIDYIIIHELTHIDHLNHSKRFWAKVAERCPDYKMHEKYLKDKNLMSKFREFL